MKVRILPVCLSVLVPLSAHAVGPIDGEIYGKINLSLDNVDLEFDVPVTVEEPDVWQLNSNASRFGFKGETSLTDNLSAIYKIEWQVDVDGEDTELGNRNRYLGLKGDFGTVLAGRHDTPLKMAQNDVDLFNDYQGGDIKNIFEGENRESNLVMYTTPTFGNVSATLAFGPSEGDSAANDLGEPGDDGPADGISALVDYNAGELYLAVAVDRDIDQQDATRAVAQYSPGDFQFGLLLQQNEHQTGAFDQSGYLVSGQYTVGDVAYKAQYGKVKEDETDVDLDTLSVGVDYRLGDATKVFVYGNRNTIFVPVTGLAFDVEADQTIIGVGMEHKF